MEELDNAIKAATADAPLVGYWVNWMAGLLLFAIVFVWKHVPARYVLASMILVFVVALGIFKATGNVHLIGLSHLLLWIPLAYYLIVNVGVPKAVNLKSAYGIWITLVLITIIISLFFDIRDLALVLLGHK